MSSRSVSRILALLLLLGSLFALQILYQNMARIETVKQERSESKSEPRVLYQAVPDFQEKLREKALREREERLARERERREEPPKEEGSQENAPSSAEPGSRKERMLASGEAGKEKAQKTGDSGEGAPPAR